MAGHGSANTYTTITTTVELYEYLTPGTYAYPMVSANDVQMPTMGSCMQNYGLIPWFIPVASTATYVVSPFGVVNYSSDLESHFCMSNGNNVNSGLIYDSLEPHQQQHYQMQPPIEPLSYGLDDLDQSPLDEEHYEMAATAPTAYAEDVPPGPRAPKRPRNCNEDAAQNAGDSSGDEEYVVPRKRKNVYCAKEGYLVEEPNSSSDEEAQGKT